MQHHSRIFLLTLAIIIFYQSTAMATKPDTTTATTSPFYIGTSIGNSKNDIRGNGVKARRSYTFSTGYEINIPIIPLRTELEYLRLKSSTKGKQETQNNGIGANIYANLPILPIMEPYIGFGLIYMKENIKADSWEHWRHSERQLIPQYMFGFDINLPLISIAGGIEYRYINSDFKFDSTKLSSKLHIFLIKARYKF